MRLLYSEAIIPDRQAHTYLRCSARVWTKTAWFQRNECYLGQWFLMDKCMCGRNMLIPGITLITSGMTLFVRRRPRYRWAERSGWSIRTTQWSVYKFHQGAGEEAHPGDPWCWSLKIPGCQGIDGNKKPKLTESPWIPCWVFSYF